MRPVCVPCLHRQRHTRSTHHAPKSVHAAAGRTITPLAGPGGAASPPAAPSAWLLNMTCPAAPSAPELPAGSCASVRASDVLPPPSPEKYLERHAAHFVLCLLHYCHGMMNAGSAAWHPGQQGARQHGSPARAVLAVSLAVDPASVFANAQLGAASSTFVWLCGDLGLDRRGVRSPTLAQAWSRPHLKRPSNVWSWPRASSNTCDALSTCAQLPLPACLRSSHQSTGRPAPSKQTGPAGSARGCGCPRSAGHMCSSCCCTEASQPAPASLACLACASESAAAPWHSGAAASSTEARSGSASQARCAMRLRGSLAWRVARSLQRTAILIYAISAKFHIGRWQPKSEGYRQLSILKLVL